jgi:predicted transcriptional regulator of viral defense system
MPFKNRYLFVHLKAEKFFGAQTVKVFQDEVQMADREKAVVDSVDKPSYAGGIAHVAAVIHQAHRSLDWEKLVTYAMRMDSRVLLGRLGFLLQTLAIPVPSPLLETMHARLGATKAYLVPVRHWGKEGTYDKAWHLICNVPEDQLFSEITIH